LYITDVKYNCTFKYKQSVQLKVNSSLKQFKSFTLPLFKITELAVIVPY